MDAVSTGGLQMDLKFSHVDVLVKNLDEACAYYSQILNARISKTLGMGTRWSACALRDCIDGTRAFHVGTAVGGEPVRAIGYVG